MKTFLFKPFEKYQETTLLSFGIAAALIGSLLGFLFNGRFDGVFDLHFAGVVMWYHPLLDNLFNILSITFFMYVAGLIINRKTRVIDILAAGTVSRAPLYFLTVFNAGNFLSRLTDKIMDEIANNPAAPLAGVAPSESIILAAFALISLLFIVWYIVLLWNGFKVATNAKGGVAVFLFSASVLLSEIISKILIARFT